MPDLMKRGFSAFSKNEDVIYNRMGKKITARGLDGQFTDSDSVEANLLFDILKELKKGKK